MPTLFILSHAPHSDPQSARTLGLAAEGDGVLLIEDAVYVASAVPSALSAAVEDARGRGVAFFALGPDAAARGVASEYPTVDYPGAVDLITRYDRSVH